MRRTQVSLTDEQIQTLREEAARRGVSMAEIVRDAIEEHLGRGRQRLLTRRARGVVGRFASGHRDIAAEHDRELEGAYADDA